MADLTLASVTDKSDEFWQNRLGSDADADLIAAVQSTHVGGIGDDFLYYDFTNGGGTPASITFELGDLPAASFSGIAIIANSSCYNAESAVAATAQVELVVDGVSQGAQTIFTLDGGAVQDWSASAAQIGSWDGDWTSANTITVVLSFDADPTSDVSFAQLVVSATVPASTTPPQSGLSLGLGTGL